MSNSGYLKSIKQAVMCKYLSTDVAQELTHQNRHLAMSMDPAWVACKGVSQWSTTADTHWDQALC